MSDPQVFTASLANRRRARRCPLSSQSKIECRKGSAGLGRNVAVATLDLSETGTRLIVQAPTTVGEEVELKMAGPGLQKPVRRVGRVVWSLLLQTGNHAIGVEFDKTLGYSDLQRLARV